MVNYPDNTESCKLMHRVQQRLSEQKSGDFNFDALYVAVQQGERDLDIATYRGLLVDKATEERGRGLYTSRAVSAGELLICKKAFFFCCAPVEVAEISSYINVLAHPKEGRVIRGAQCDMVTMAIQKIFRNPSYAVDALSFYCGDY
jgi:hypothetical protein